MARIKRLSILFLVIFLLMASSACESTDKDRYLEKEKLSLQDMEQLFADEGFNLTKAGESAGSLMLQVRNASVFYIHKNNSRKLDIYIFNSDAQREAARQEFDRLTTFMSMISHQVYEAKNVLVILWAGELSNADYSNVSRAMTKAQITSEK